MNIFTIQIVKVKRYNDVLLLMMLLLGFEVVVLRAAGSEWSLPWWTWLLVGMVVLLLLICLARWALRITGVMREDRPVR